MSYPYQITSQAQYEQAYKESIENPEKFWAAVADHFQWRKNGTRCWNGILKNQK
jgi:acetyl-CoA synthetase